MAETLPKSVVEFFRMYDQIESLSDMVVSTMLREKETAEVLDYWLNMLQARRKEMIEKNDEMQSVLYLMTTMGLMYGMKRCIERIIEEREGSDDAGKRDA